MAVAFGFDRNEQAATLERSRIDPGTDDDLVGIAVDLAADEASDISQGVPHPWSVPEDSAAAANCAVVR